MLFSLERFDSFPVIADMSFVSFHVSSGDKTLMATFQWVQMRVPVTNLPDSEVAIRVSAAVYLLKPNLLKAKRPFDHFSIVTNSKNMLYFHHLTLKNM